MLDELIVFFVLGCMGTFILGALAFLIYLLINIPMSIIYIGGMLGFLLSVGWCIAHWDDFYNLFRTQEKTAPKSISDPIPYGIPVLDKLTYFERKYKISTTVFLTFVCEDVIPLGMNNLDYLEWISLINDLPFLISKRK